MKNPKVILKPEFRMNPEEIKKYNELPDNLPDTKLTTKQIDFIRDLYRRYIGQQIDNQSWNTEMYKVEQGEKWPSGPRVKNYEAMRFILSNLIYCNSKTELTPVEAAKKFHGVITLRPMYSRLVYYVYDLSQLYK